MVGPERFLAHDPERVIDVCQHRRLVEEATLELWRAPAAGQDARAARPRLVDLLGDFLAVAIANQWPDLVVGARPGAKPQRADILHQAIGERL